MKPIPRVMVGQLGPVEWPRKFTADRIMGMRRRGEKLVRRVFPGVTCYYSESRFNPYLFSITKP